MDFDLRAAQVRLFLKKWDSLVEGFEIKVPVDVNTFCDVGRVGPNAIKYDDDALALNFSETYGYPGNIKLKNHGSESTQLGWTIKGGFSISADIFPVLDVLNREQLLFLNDPDIDPLAIFFGTTYEFEANLIKNSPFLLSTSEHLRRIFVFFRTLENQEAMEGVTDPPMEQALAFVGSLRLAELCNNYVVYLSDRIRINNILTSNSSKDELGNIILERVKRLIKPVFRDYGIEVTDGLIEDLNLMNHFLDEESDQSSSESDKGNKGRDFEAKCADFFNNLGFHVEVTPTTGDFGADLLVEKRSCVLVVQCKCQSRPVGVTAIQEAAAASHHFGANGSIVMSESGFTEAAYKLSKTNRVFLGALNAFSDKDIESLLCLSP